MAMTSMKSLVNKFVFNHVMHVGDAPSGRKEAGAPIMIHVKPRSPSPEWSESGRPHQMNNNNCKMTTAAPTTASYSTSDKIQGSEDVAQAWSGGGIQLTRHTQLPEGSQRELRGSSIADVGPTVAIGELSAVGGSGKGRRRGADKNHMLTGGRAARDGGVFATSLGFLSKMMTFNMTAALRPTNQPTHEHHLTRQERALAATDQDGGYIFSPHRLLTAGYGAGGAALHRASSQVSSKLYNAV